MKRTTLVATACLVIALLVGLFITTPIQKALAQLTCLVVVITAGLDSLLIPLGPETTGRTRGVLAFLYSGRLLAYMALFVMVGAHALPHDVKPPLPSWMWFVLAWIALITLMALWLRWSLSRACQLQHSRTERKVRGHCEKFLAYWAVLIAMFALAAVLDLTGTEGAGHIPLGTALVSLVTVNAIGVVLDAHRDLQTGLIEAHDDEVATTRADQTERALNELLRRQRAQQDKPHPPRILQNLFRS